MKGSIQKRGKNSWRITVDLGKDILTSKRKRHTETINGTKKDAQKKLREILYRIDNNSFVKTVDIAFGHFMSEWLNQKEMEVRESTFISYESLSTRLIIPNIGHFKISNLTYRALNEFYRKILVGEIKGVSGKKLSSRTIQYCHRLINQCLSNAMKMGLIQSNPASLATPPLLKQQEIKVWNHEELKLFLNVAKQDYYYVVFFIATMTGMRKGEVLALRWKDIDFKNNSVSVQRTLIVSKQGLKFGPPKTLRSRRLVAISQTTSQELLKIRSCKKKVEDLVAGTPKGTPLDPRNLDRRFKRIIMKAGLPKIRFHDLRHTHATLLLKAGQHPKVVSERLGHSSVTITLDTYSHVLPSLQREAADCIDKYLFK